MRVGILTSYQPHEIGIAWATLPLMRRYCRARGYTLAVGQGMSSEGMFERFGDQFETAMLFLPISFVVTDTLVPLAYGAPPTTEPPAGLGIDCTGRDLQAIRKLAYPKRGFDWATLDNLILRHTGDTI